MWQSAGADGYTVEPCDKADVGTEVVLHIKPDTDDENFSEYLEEYRIQELVKKYSDYVHTPIRMEVEHSHMKERPADAGEDWKPEYDADAGFEIVDLEGEDVIYRIRDDCTYHVLEDHQGECVELSREEFVQYWRETEFPIFWAVELEDGEVKNFAEWYLP